MLFIAFAGFLGRPPGTIACRLCGARIASEDDLMQVLGRPVQAAYVNPLGLACEIVTLGRATNIAGADVSTGEHTWFEGYAWRPVACASCGQHLGWRYEASSPHLAPQAFFGLLVGTVTRPGDPGRDM